MNQLLSVVVTIYNCESFIPRCLDSILAQTYKDIEIIIVNDGSEDGSGNVCSEYASNYPQIRYVKKENGGTVSARKVGVKMARGKYLAFVDGDDYLEEDMYKKYISVLEQERTDIVIGCITKDYPEKKIVIKNRVPDGKYEKGNNYDELLTNLVDAGPFMDGGIHASLCSKVFVLDKIKKWALEVDEKLVYGEDAATLYPCIAECNSISVKSLTGYHWIMHETSKTHKKDSEYLLRLYYLEVYMQKVFNLFWNSQDAECMLFRYMLNQIVNALHKEYRFCEQYVIKEKHRTNSNFLYLFPFETIKKGSRIIIYGNGNVGKELYRQIVHSNYCEIIAVADKNSIKRDLIGKKVISPGEIIYKEFDAVVIAVHDERIAEEIRNELLDYGISNQKIVWQNYIV